jgi:ABC-type dipeptide/oligopeptide/nickel transport system ATPase component
MQSHPPQKEVSLKNVFALRGTSKTGKSQTIRTVVEMLTENHPEASTEHNHTTKVDTRVVLTINGRKIGIESRLINDSLDLFVDARCDVIVCATRTSGATVNAVNALQGFDIHWVEQPKKSQPYEQILRSMTIARQIVEEVEALIKPALVRTMAATA